MLHILFLCDSVEGKGLGFFHPLLSLNSSSQPVFFLSCKDLIIFIINNLWLCVLWPTRSFYTLRKCTYPLQLHDPFSLDLGFTPGILITGSLMGYAFWSHLWMSFLNFEELTVGVTVFLRPGLVEPWFSLHILSTQLVLLVFIQGLVNHWLIHSGKTLSMNSGSSRSFLPRLFDVCFASDFLVWVSKLSIGVCWHNF